MSFKNKIQQYISKKSKKKARAKKLNALKKQSNKDSERVFTLNSFWVERLPIFAALFLFAFGMGLIADGKKIYSHQLKLSQRVDYKATLNAN
jgi:hypothetical protein